MITLVVSGGQSGADQAGWRAAQVCGIETGGWMPLHFMTEDGPDGSLGRLYGAKAMPTGSYAARTARNVRESDGTIWFGTTDTPGAKTTLEVCELWRKPVMIIEPHRSILPSDAVQWLRNHSQIQVLNIVGNRESKNPGIGERVERFLTVVFRRFVQSEQESQRRR
jgi:Circularly permutated YpsA SLOG family